MTKYPKKIIIILAISTVSILIFLMSTAILIAFTIVKPATDSINGDLANYFQRIVRIPKGIPAPSYSFDQTSYIWEMETLEREVIGVRFNYQTGFVKEVKNLEVSLEMAELGDPSIFNKVLPAVIADGQSLKSAQDPPKANLVANSDVGYSSIALLTTEKTNQTILITWTFAKDTLPSELRDSYRRLEKYPTPILRILYGLPSLIFGLLSG